MMGWIGAVELAAHQIVVTFGNFAFMAMVGISSATTILVSHRFGRGDLDGLTRAATASCHLALMTNFLTMCCFIGLRHWIPLLFTSDTAVAAVAAQLFIMAGLYQFSDGLQVVLLGVLRGMQDVKIVMRYAFVSYIVINLPGRLSLRVHARHGGSGAVGRVYLRSRRGRASLLAALSPADPPDTGRGRIDRVFSLRDSAERSVGFVSEAIPAENCSPAALSCRFCRGGGPGRPCHRSQRGGLFSDRTAPVCVDDVL